MRADEPLSIAIPNKGRLYDSVKMFLERCALKIHRESERQYWGMLDGIKHPPLVAFQRARDITKFVSNGGADFGITGYDLFQESRGLENEDLIMVFPNLYFGECELVIAVPDHWVEISNLGDLAELVAMRKESKEGRLKIATEFPNLTRKFLLEKGITYFSIVEVDGAAESAPAMGSAEIISDLKTSGVTLAENRLKLIERGRITSSSACMFANRETLRQSESKLRATQYLLDRIESYLHGRHYYMLTANVPGDSDEAIASKLLAQNYKAKGLAGMQGPTIAAVWRLGKSGKAVQDMYSVTIIAERDDIEDVVSHLRTLISGADILVSSISFVYNERPLAYLNLKEALPKRKSGQ